MSDLVPVISRGGYEKRSEGVGVGLKMKDPLVLFLQQILIAFSKLIKCDAKLSL